MLIIIIYYVMSCIIRKGRIPNLTKTLGVMLFFMRQHKAESTSQYTRLRQINLFF